MLKDFILASYSLFFSFLVSADKHSRPKPLNIDEEQFIRVFYENKLQEVCNNFHFPHKKQKQTWSLLLRLLKISLCSSGNSSHIFQKVLFAMVGYATSSKKHNVRLKWIWFQFPHSMVYMIMIYMVPCQDFFFFIYVLLHDISND